MNEATAGGRSRALYQFEVLGELGTGAASKILHILDPASFQHYAMKVVIRRSAEEQKYLDQAKHEYEVAQRLDHPGLIKVFDIRVIHRWFREREVRTLLEYVNGESLEEMKRPGVPVLVLIFAEVAEAVGYMHRQGVYHADLKPNNIMVSRSGQVKVIDFGLAWLRGQQKYRVQGTIGYLAPEQVKHRVVNEATEVFNIGATLYRMLTGQSASGLAGGGPGNFIPAQGILTPPHVSNPEVPKALGDLVMACCELKPQNRPAGMARVASSLRELIQTMQLDPESLPDLLRASGRGNSG